MAQGYVYQDPESVGKTGSYLLTEPALKIMEKFNSDKRVDMPVIPNPRSA